LPPEAAAHAAQLQDAAPTGPDMKVKERYVFLECTVCKHRNYTTHKRLKAAYKLEKKKYCNYCRAHTSHREKKL
jgi:large subunit ribosomal protein L33